MSDYNEGDRDLFERYMLAKNPWGMLQVEVDQKVGDYLCGISKFCYRCTNGVLSPEERGFLRCSCSGEPCRCEEEVMREFGKCSGCCGDICNRCKKRMGKGVMCEVCYGPFSDCLVERSEEIQNCALCGSTARCKCKKNRIEHAMSQKWSGILCKCQDKRSTGVENCGGCPREVCKCCKKRRIVLKSCSKCSGNMSKLRRRMKIQCCEIVLRYLYSLFVATNPDLRLSCVVDVDYFETYARNRAKRCKVWFISKQIFRRCFLRQVLAKHPELMAKWPAPDPKITKTFINQCEDAILKSVESYFHLVDSYLDSTCERFDESLWDAQEQLFEADQLGWTNTEVEGNVQEPNWGSLAFSNFERIWSNVDNWGPRIDDAEQRIAQNGLLSLCFDVNHADSRFSKQYIMNAAREHSTQILERAKVCLYEELLTMMPFDFLQPSNYEPDQTPVTASRDNFGVHVFPCKDRCEMCSGRLEQLISKVDNAIYSKSPKLSEGPAGHPDYPSPSDYLPLDGPNGSTPGR